MSLDLDGSGRGSSPSTQFIPFTKESGDMVYSLPYFELYIGESLVPHQRAASISG